jgi:uncharacterized protein YqeY
MNPCEFGSACPAAPCKWIARAKASLTIGGMSLQARIGEDLKAAMKARESARLGVLRMLKAALKNAAIEKGGADAELTEIEALAVVRKQVKQRQDAIAGFEKGNRPELADKEKQEIDVLSSYLPKELSDPALQKLVTDSIREAGASSKAQMGAVMKIAQAKAAGRADGRRLSQEVQKQLS